MGLHEFEMTVPSGVVCGFVDDVYFSTLTRSGSITDGFGNTPGNLGNQRPLNAVALDNCKPVINLFNAYSTAERPAAGTLLGTLTASDMPLFPHALTWEISGQTDIGGHGLFPWILTLRPENWR